MNAKILDLRYDTDLCPAPPVMKIIAVLDELKVGQSVEIIHENKADEEDIVAWVAKIGQKIVSKTTDGKIRKIILEKTK